MARSIQSPDDSGYDRTVVTTGVTRNKIQILRSEKLGKLPWLIHGFSTRLGGVSRPYGGRALNLGFTKEDSRSAVNRNHELFLKELGATNGAARRNTWPLVSLRQIHSDLIHRVDESEATREPLAGDGLLTDTPEIIIAVQTADCLPIILVDRKRGAVGVFHAGWRGTVQRIVEKGVGEMRKHFKSDPRNLLAAIGPGIQSCCYEVGEEVRIKFEAQFAYASALFREVKESDPVREKYPLLFLTARAPGHSELPVKIFLDLVEANRRQLIDAGVPAKNIDIPAPCTGCHKEILFSYRAEKGVTGRMMAAAGIKPR
ncbi:MAG TPA: peptidoglycan editing factor PgeF [Terriglobales bacterium]|nr:peptidoglycan editing factor PgeF [Terriglobales bacterium]